MSRVSSALRGIVCALLCASVASADPAPQSSLPWVVQGPGPVARAGRTLFFGNTYGLAPRANRAQGIAVFSQGESVGESIDAADGLPDISRVIADGAGGWYAGGPFTTFGGLARSGMVHILPNGKVDPAFTADLSAFPEVFGMALNGSQLIIAGFFTTVNLVPRNGLAWVNAATGQVLPIVPVATGSVRAMTLSGTTLFVAGSTIKALNASTGAAVAGFVSPVCSSTCGIYTMTVEGPSLYVGGLFFSLNGTARASVARLDTATGYVDPGWNPGAYVAGTPGQVNSMVVTGGAVYLGGSFDTLAGQPRANLAAVSTASGTATAWRVDVDRTVYGLVLQAGALYLGGNFSAVAGVPRLGGAAVSVSAPATVLPWDPSIVGLPRGVAGGAGKIALFGSFNGWGVNERRGLSAVDAITGELLAWNADPEGRAVNEMVVDGGRLIIGGAFLRVNGESRTSLAAFDLETRALLPLAATIDGPVLALAVANGVLYIGGSFSTVNGMFRINLAALDLQTGQVLPWDPQTDGVVIDIVTRPNSVIVGGAFTSLIGTNGFRTRVGVGEITFAGAVTAFDANISSAPCTWQPPTDRLCISAARSWQSAR